MVEPEARLDRPSFEGFVANRGAALQRTAFLLTGDWGHAEDLLQTALARVYPRWERIVRDDPEAYVRKALVNTWSSWWRRKWRGELPTAELHDRPGIDPYTDADRRGAVATALGGLPPKQRAVIVLRFHEDLTEAQVADVLGISVGTVKSQTAKALSKLRADAALSGYGAPAAGGE
ncbi:MAG TPA: SigE family RNA polymerase sigma factor [Mycobacteriales bacterium]|nr:SigE family RNA polymerase sigma factor [Mycobacteriales bacterium]